VITQGDVVGNTDLFRAKSGIDPDGLEVGRLDNGL
jgi:hypothetical protein